MNINYFYGKSFHSNSGENKQCSWNEFIKIFGNPIVQKIEVSDYKKLLETKDNLQSIHISDRTEKQKQELKNIQMDIAKYKDVHYIIGGNFVDNKRSNGNDKLLFRNLIALDIDNTSKAIWNKIKAFNKFEHILHTSFSHTPEKPKLRLFLPIEKVSNKIEYETIVRNLISDMGLSVYSNDNPFGEVDAASIKYNQLMFLPNIPKHAEYIFKHNVGEILDTSKYLKVKTENINISDIKSNIPISPYEMKDTSIIKQFCLKYNIHDTISKFLSDIYIDRKNDRYTYADSSSKLGAVVYPDNKGNHAVFLYTNHGSDPLNDCHLHNSFDLIKEHKFGGNLDNTINFVKSLLPNNSNISQNNNQQSVDNSVDIFEQINIYISDKKSEENIPLSEGCFLPENYKSGYYMVKKGFCKRYIFKQTNDIGEKEEMYTDKILIPIKIYPTKIYIVNGFEEIEYNSKNLCDNDSFSSVSKFKTWLKKFGKTLWFDGETKDLVGLEKYINIYRYIAKLEPIKAKSKMGWSKDGFTPYNGIDIFTKNDSPEIKNLIESFEENGNFETWKKYIIDYSNNDTFRIYLNTSLAAPLISLLKRPAFWVHNYAKQSSGKTPALFAAASIFANPEKYAPSFNTTRVGLEFKLHMLGNMPCMFDDSQNLNEWSKKHISSLIYDVANGHGKTRGNIQGDVQESKYWYTTMLTNGEQELLQGNEFEGAIKRLMEFDTIPFKNHKQAREARNIFLNNYGFAGKIFINLIQKYKNEILNILNDIENILNNDINYPTHIQNVATMSICDYILSYHILGLNQEQSFDNAIEWGKNVLKLLPGEKETDKTNIGIDLIKEYVISNTHKFRVECPSGRVGFFRNGEVYFFPIEFKKLLKEWGIPQTRFLKELKELDISITDNTGQFKAMKYNNRTIRPIGLYNEDVTETMYNFSDYS